MDVAVTGKSSSDPNSHAQGAAGFQELLGRAFDRIPVAMLFVGRDGRIIKANAQAERIFGYARDELLDKPVEQLVPGRYRQAHPGFRRNFLLDPQARPMGAGRELYGLRKDGSEFPVEIGLNPVDTADGPVVISAIVDITERRRMEQRFQQVVESAPNAMVLVNGSGTIVMVNAETEKMFGYAREELLGESVEMLVPGRFGGKHADLRHAYAVEPQARPMGARRDLYALRKDGSEFPVEIGLNPIQTEEGPMVLGAVVDITERKQREEGVRAALKEKELLLGEIHHRVKNNLQIIHSLLDLQRSQIGDEGVRAMLRESQNRVLSMSLIHQMLYQTQDFAEVDFQRFLNSLLPVLLESYSIDPDRISLEVNVSQAQLPIGVAIPCGLVVNELVTNALKHAFPAARSGRITVELAAGDAGEAALSVANDGAPIPEGLDLSRGTTLGMQLVHLLAEQIGGRIEVRRADPTRFTLRFPHQRR